jgi:hypothetical protein
MKVFVLLISLTFLFSDLNAQNILGCTDQQANNYNESATINDGSCTYNPSIYKPDFRFLLPSEVEETSGLISYANGFWTINDSGGEPIIYKLDTLNGEIIQRISLNDAENIDWEDIAQDDNFIYVGDHGNNSGNRDDLAIYKVKKSDIPENGDTSVDVEKIMFSYSDYTTKVKKKKDNNFDCEALIATDQWIYLFSKNRGDNQSKLYKLSKNAGEHTAELITTFNTAGLITGADLSQNKNELILIGYTNNSWIPFLWIMFDFEGENFYSGNKRRIDMLNVTATQTEGICYVNGKKGIISSENNPLFNQTMYNFTTNQWTDQQPSALVEFEEANLDFKIIPNPVKKNKLTLYFESLAANQYDIAIYDSMGRMMTTEKYKVNRHEKGAKIKIKINKFKTGIYFVRVSSESGIAEKKFIKE